MGQCAKAARAIHAATSTRTSGARKSSRAASRRRMACAAALLPLFLGALRNDQCRGKLRLGESALHPYTNDVRFDVNFRPLASTGFDLPYAAKTSCQTSRFASNLARVLLVSFLLMSKCLSSRSDSSLHYATMAHAVFTGALLPACPAGAHRAVGHQRGRVR